MKQLVYYCTLAGKEPCKEWLEEQELLVRRKIFSYLVRLAVNGSKKNVRAVGDGLFELKIDYGPGYRVYFAEIKSQIILLIFRGDKGSQFRDIHTAKQYWRAYVPQ